MFDVTATWQKSTSDNVEQYTVAWTLNGAPAAPSLVPQSAAADLSGYTADFNTANPTLILKFGDTVSVAVVANDTVNGLNSTATASSPLTIPTPPPTPPAAVASVTLTLSGSA